MVNFRSASTVIKAAWKAGHSILVSRSLLLGPRIMPLSELAIRTEILEKYPITLKLGNEINNKSKWTHKKLAVGSYPIQPANSQENSPLWK